MEKLTYRINGFNPESADDILQRLQSCVAGAGSLPLHTVYAELNVIMHRMVEQRIADSHINFGGLFAKIDYLSKQYEVDKSVTMAVNDLRNRLRKLQSFSDDELRNALNVDVEALCKFIAKVYPGTVIPQALQALYPKTHQRVSVKRLETDCLRVIVDSWDDRYIYAHSDEEKVVVCYDLLNEMEVSRLQSGDWTYVRQLLSEGLTINLVRPRARTFNYSRDLPAGGQNLDGDGAAKVLYPELIIVSPDYLVDISTVASCFESYDESPYVSLINKFSEMDTSVPILLGNLASQLLDESVHSKTPVAYADSIRRYFRDNALQMAATEGLDSTFHKQAVQQQVNIERAIKETLEKEVGSFDVANVILEPSFFCEMLGLQGRMDLLQRDYRVLIEQKSGKCGYPQQNPDVPVQQEKHYVQMLLYMAVLNYGYEYDGQKVTNADIQSFLLYSKYKQSLLRLGPAPELLFRALKIRNQLAWFELSYAKGGAEVLNRLTPELLRRKEMRDTFWEQWVRPKLDAVLRPIHQASELERRYFFRFFRFVALEHILSKMGNNTKENSGFASKWHDTLADKLLAGNIYAGMSIIDMGGEDEGDGGITWLRLCLDSSISVDAANFRKGDIVVLYSYQQGSDPDVRKSMVFRCSIDDIKEDEVRLVLRAPQSDPSVFSVRKNFFWALEHDFFESSSSGLYRGLHLFVTAPQERRDLILMQRPPQVDETKLLVNDYGKFNPLVQGALRAKDMFLVIGPPGTGKTSFGLMNILKESLSHGDGADILLMSYTNRAVDEVCSKLVSPDDGSAPYDFVRIGNPLSCDPAYRKYLLCERADEFQKVDDVRRLVADTHIFVGTVTSMAGSRALFSMKTFDVAIIDEASQILEPHLLPLLCATVMKDGTAVPVIRKFVMIGDHKQLPAVVQQSQEESQVDDAMLNGIGLRDCRYSLFERMLTAYRDNPDVVYMLRNQGRMHGEIAEFSNASFYEGLLDVVPLKHQVEKLPLHSDYDNPVDNLIATHRVAFIPSALPEQRVSDKVNMVEARMIASLVYHAYRLYKADFNVSETIGVIVPYRNQITAVRNAIDAYGEECLHDIMIDTVERFQGSQCEVIIYGFTIQYPYQLNFLAANVFEENGHVIDRKLNVALTRARRHLLLVGNPSLLSRNEVFRSLMDFCREHDSYVDINLLGDNARPA